MRLRGVVAKKRTGTLLKPATMPEAFTVIPAESGIQGL